MRVGWLVMALGMAAVLLPTAACTGDDGGGDQTAVPVPVADDDVERVPAPDDSPFCRTMLELDEDPTLELDAIVATYVDLTDDVPAEIRPEYDVVVRRLVALDRGEPVDDPEAAERAAEALAEFIEIRCRGTSVSPLPPPTEPG